MDTKTPATILVATDFSDGSDEALQRAIALAKQWGARLDLLPVDRMLTRLASQVEASGVACTPKIVEGNAANEITDRARTLGADMIVVGTHGRTGLAHIVLGSIAERVVRHATCPVLTVPFSKKAA